MILAIVIIWLDYYLDIYPHIASYFNELIGVKPNILLDVIVFE